MKWNFSIIHIDVFDINFIIFRVELNGRLLGTLGIKLDSAGTKDNKFPPYRQHWIYQFKKENGG